MKEVLNEDLRFVFRALLTQHPHMVCFSQHHHIISFTKVFKFMIQSF